VPDTGAVPDPEGPSSRAAPAPGGTASGPETWDAYVTAEIRIEVPGETGAVRVFAAPPLHTSGQYPDPAGRALPVITAHNPHGAIVADEVNAAAQRRLEAELDGLGLEWWPAAGADPAWTHVEQSVAVPGMSEADALDLGSRYGQLAIFVLTPAGRKVIDCATGRRSITGWIIAAEAGLTADGQEDDCADDALADDGHSEGDHAVAAKLAELAEARGTDPSGWDVLVLAESRWEPADNGDGPAAGEFLLRLEGAGPATCYVVYETDGVEWEWESLDARDAADDESAIAAFKAATGAEQE
jgi:hypothetical protein